MANPVQNEPAWYQTWFDSPYYHTLYQKRDEHEAQAFIDHLLAILSPAPGARMLDLACGRGRYSRHLAQQGYTVVGLDLSVASIQYARQFEHPNLEFYTHDMRLPFRTNYFDYIFSFFTSFGYFERRTDDLKTLQSVARGLRPGGVFVLDFFNTRYVLDRLIGPEEKTLDGITFRTHKRVEGAHIIKTIDFEDGGRVYHFEEKVELLQLPDFASLFAQAGLRLQYTYGDYGLHPFDPATSPRLILQATRI